MRFAWRDRDQVVATVTLQQYEKMPQFAGPRKPSSGECTKTEGTLQ